MKLGGGKCWFTAAELAELALPGLPRTKRKINERAGAESWVLRIGADGVPLGRRRLGRGGGAEYHVDVLPAASRAALAKLGIGAVAHVSAEPETRAAALWRAFDAATGNARAEAERRMQIMSSIEAIEHAGMTRTAAIASTAARFGVGTATIWQWRGLIEGVPPADRLAYLLPSYAGGGAEADVDPEAWQILVSDYLRPEKPTFTSCYYRVRDCYAGPRGIVLPHERTLRRKLEREIDPRMVIARRDGAEALRRTLPPQKRSVADLHAMELVNIDGHRWDVFVRWPDGTIARPMMIGIQDVYSRKFLAWSVGKTESAIETRLAFAHLFERYGVPIGCLMDNGRAFASKWITGGATSRFRFKIREEEPLGILTALGIKIHWATPYRGQSKPIERMFGDFCDKIAKHPAFSGAYTGNRPDAKPENYGNAAIPLDRFLEVAEAAFAAHNALPGRRTEMGAGVHSLDQVFADSYAIAPIGKAAPEQLRLALLAADDRPTDRQSGAINMHGNRYWTEALGQIAGQRVTVRFDPDDLHAPVHVYDRNGRYLCSAPVIEASGFLDVEAAKRRKKLEKDLRVAVKGMIEAEELLDAERVAALLPGVPGGTVPEPAVLRPVRHRGQTAAALRPVAQRASNAVSEAAQGAAIDRMAAGMARLRSVK